MNYCLIEDAWVNNNITTHYDTYHAHNEYQKNSSKKENSHTVKSTPIIEHFETSDKCSNIIKHFIGCNKCQKEVLNHLIKIFFNILHSYYCKNKEIIIILLLIYFIFITLK